MSLSLHIVGTILGRTTRTFQADDEQPDIQFIIVLLICFEGQRIHLFSGHIFNITVDFVASAVQKQSTAMPRRKCIIMVFVGAFKTRDLEGFQVM